MIKTNIDGTIATIVWLAAALMLMAFLSVACGTPTAPTRTQIGRNVDGTPHYLGDAYQPWYDTKVTPRDPKTGRTIQHPPTP